MGKVIPFPEKTEREPTFLEDANELARLSGSPIRLEYSGEQDDLLGADSSFSVRFLELFQKDTQSE